LQKTRPNGVKMSQKMVTQLTILYFRFEGFIFGVIIWLFYNKITI